MPGCGCLRVCCKGCSCCVAKNQILANKDQEINDLKTQVLNLMARRTNLGGGISLAEENTRLIQEIQELKQVKEGLTADNNRLRGERNNYWQVGKELTEEKQEVAELIENFSQTLERLKQEIRELKAENQTLKNKIEKTNGFVTTTPPRGHRS